MLRNIYTVMTIFDQYQFEKQLNQHIPFMQQAEKEQKAREIIRNHVGFSLGAALVPFPAADLIAVSAVQLNMLRQLAKLYQVGFMDQLGRNFISAVVGGSAARLGASLIKIIPGVGTVIGEISMPILSGASTYALGSVIARHFQQGGTLEDFDLAGARKKYRSEMEEGKKVATSMQQTPEKAPVNGATDDIVEKIKKLAELKDAGILTEAEFSQMKEKLLNAI